MSAQFEIVISEFGMRYISQDKFGMWYESKQVESVIKDRTIWDEI